MRTAATIFAGMILLLAGVPGGTHAQSYSDVLVVVNSNSTLSVNIGDYFKSQRSVPSVNMCSIAMPTTDEIDSAQCASILSSIKTYMSSNKLTTQINYIVTTQGVPLRVARSNYPTTTMSNSSSFDNELCLLNSGLESQIGQNSYVSNPYYTKTARFSRSSSYNSIYLVTRLAGYSYTDVTGLIDRAVSPYHSIGKFVLDEDLARGRSFLNVNMETARNVLRNRGFNVLLDSSNVYVTGQTNVLGYVSWGSNDANWSSYSWKAQPNNDWSAKALAETYVSTSGRTFSDSTFSYSGGWQSLVADLIHEGGVTGVKGYVYEPYTLAMADVGVLFDRWTSSTGYNLAESYYSASAVLGWMDVVVGDPKATFAGNGHLPVELISFNGAFIDRSIRLTWKTATESNNYGFEIQKQSGSDWTTLGFVAGRGTVNTPTSYSFTDELPSATNIYRLKQMDRDGGESFSSIIEVAAREQQRFVLEQNYPNPFNPSTAISYTLPEESTVELVVYSLTGEEITRIVSAELQQQGQHAAFWIARDRMGADLPSGLYLYRMTAVPSGGGASWTATRTMSLIR